LVRQLVDYTARTIGIGSRRPAQVAEGHPPLRACMQAQRALAKAFISVAAIGCDQIAALDI